MEDNDDFTKLSLEELIQRQAKRTTTTYAEWCKKNNRKPYWEEPTHA